MANKSKDNNRAFGVIALILFAGLAVANAGGYFGEERSPSHDHARKTGRFVGDVTRLPDLWDETDHQGEGGVLAGWVQAVADATGQEVNVAPAEPSSDAP